MAHIEVPDGVPGIRSLVMFRPETGKHLYQLAQVLLRDPSSLSPADRELIATYVSAKNNCQFCMSSHAAAARELFGDDKATGTTLSSTYKKLYCDITGGLSAVKFFVDGAQVGTVAGYDMSALASGLNVQPFVQLHKASGTGTPAVTLAQWGITYEWSYGA